MRLLLVAMLLGLSLLVPIPVVAQAADYPARDAGYTSYAEMVEHIKEVAAARPDIVRVFSIGKSYQGRKIWAAEISDNVGTDEGEPEILFDGLHHAREHLGAEMAIYIFDLLSNQYGKKSDLGKRVTKLVNKRRTWIVFMVNPDGLVYDLGGDPYRSWRKNRQPTPGSSKVGTDLNRNYGYRFGCCGGSSGRAGSSFYRGPRAWSAPETRALRDFVQSRVVKGRQRIRTHITFHAAGEAVLWPYAYTRDGLPSDMTRLDRRVFRAMGRTMAASNGYSAKQSSAFYPSDGDMIDWMYGRQRIFSYTFELYPRGGSAKARHYPPDEIIGRGTERNRVAVVYLMGKARCPYSSLGPQAARAYCGPFFDDLEVSRGWKVDPDGTDTATDGRWQRGDPVAGGLQLGDAASGRFVLVTGRAAGRDVDGGRTTVRSPLFRIPADGRATLRLRYWVGLSSNATGQDGLRVRLVDKNGALLAELLAVSGNGQRRAPRWRGLTRILPADRAGELVAIELRAVDGGAGSTVETGIDQVRVSAD
ncbi:MAG: M14 family metallopeptidase [Chloroflexota bacterium]